MGREWGGSKAMAKIPIYKCPICKEFLERGQHESFFYCKKHGLFTKDFGRWKHEDSESDDKYFTPIEYEEKDEDSAEKK